MLTKKFLPALLACGMALPASSALAFDDNQKGEIEDIVREYLLENPEIIFEMQDVLQARQQAAQEEQQTKALAELSNDIFQNPDDPVLGNPNGDVTLVEFFDYNCGFCRRGHSDLITLIEGDANLRIVKKEFPIRGPDSQDAHAVSLAFNALRPDNYATFLDRLMTEPGTVNEASALALALELGANEDALMQELQNPEIARQINGTYALAEQLGISGTPAYIIGDKIVSGAVGSAELAEHIKEARECAVTSC